MSGKAPLTSPVTCYQLGPWRVDSQQNTLTAAQQVKVLEPKSMAILVYFIEHPHEVITRTSLFEQFWPNQVVSEDALNRAISNIRRNLGDSSSKPQFLATVRNQGYKLLVLATPITDTTKTNTTHTNTTKAKTIPIIASAALLLIFALVLILIVPSSNHSISTTTTTPNLSRLSYDNGHNIMAKRSHDGEYLTFITQGPNNHQLKFRRFDRTYAQPIGDEQHNYSYPVFSANNHITALELQRDKQQIVSFNPFKSSANKTVIQPLTAPSQGLDQQNQLVVYSNPHPINGKPSIYLLSNQQPVLLTNANNALRDIHPNLSPTASHISFIRQYSQHQFKLITIDLNGNQIAQSDQYSTIHSFDWITTQQLIIFAQNQQIRINIAGKPSQTTIRQLNPIPYYAHYHQHSNSLLFSDIETSSQIYSYPITASNNQQPQRLTQSQTQDRQAAISDDGFTLAFVSNRSGYRQIWIRQNNQTYPITQSSADQLFDLTFSPNNQQLSAIAKSEQQYWLLHYHLATQQLKKRKLQGAAHIVGWPANNQLLLTQQTKHWRLYQFNRHNQSLNKLSELDIQQARLTPNKRRLVFRNNQSNTLWLYDWQGQPQPLTGQIPLQQNWFIDNHNLYYLTRNNSGATLWQQAFKTPSAKPLNNLPISNFADRPQAKIYNFITSQNQPISAQIWSLSL